MLWTPAELVSKTYIMFLRTTFARKYLKAFVFNAGAQT
jgi:hypothetical protein